MSYSLVLEGCYHCKKELGQLNKDMIHAMGNFKKNQEAVKFGVSILHTISELENQLNREESNIQLLDIDLLFILFNVINQLVTKIVESTKGSAYI